MLNEWLEAAPKADVICGQAGALVCVNDLIGRESLALTDGGTFVTGKYRFRYCRTPHLPHGWGCWRPLWGPKPEIVVMDLSMPELGGLEATAEILKENPKVKILILSMFSNEAYIRKAFEVGAKGYMLKNAIEVDLNRAVRALSGRPGLFQPGNLPHRAG